MGLDSRPNARVVDAWVVRTQTRQADCLKCIHLPGAPRGHGIAVAAADVHGTAKLNFSHLCYLPEVRAPRDTGRGNSAQPNFPTPAISADAWAGAVEWSPA